MTVNGASASGSYVDCAALSANQVRFHVTSSNANSYVHPVVFQDLNSNNKLDAQRAMGYRRSGALRPAGGGHRQPQRHRGRGEHRARLLHRRRRTATYRYDSNDTFQRSGAALSLAQFEQLISRGDTLAVSYQADDTGASTFNITNDVGREAPTVTATVDSWDRGPTQNDVGVRFTEPATNVDDVGYTIQRASTGVGASCDASSGAYAELQQTVIGRGQDSELYIDRDLAVGAYCYRVGAMDPTTGATAFGYSQRVVINNPPTPVAPPRSLDARITTSAGSPALLDIGDVIKIAFDKTMQSPLGTQMTVRDVDGTIAEVRCLLSEQACTLNSGAETLGGVTYPANTVITITMRTERAASPRGQRPVFSSM